MNDQNNKQLSVYSAQANQENINDIHEKLGGMRQGPIKRIWMEVMALWEMIKDPTAAWSSKTIAIGALLYLISPLDAIPDLIPVLGLTDDASVILAAASALSYQLAKYKLKQLSKHVSRD